MTWREIKQAVEDAGVSDDDEIGLIQCENQQRFSLDRGNVPPMRRLVAEKS